MPLLAYSADLAAAGINQAATGEQTNTFFFEGTKKTAKVLGASEEEANNIAIGTDIVVGAALTAGSSNTKYIGTIPKVVAKAGAANTGVPLNRLNHIFGKSEHALESFVTKFGSQEKAYNAVQNAANQALKAGKLTPNAQGILPKVGEILNVGGMNVRLIGGKVENGRVIISSFSRKGL